MIRSVSVLISAASMSLFAVGIRADLGPLEPVADLHRAVRESLGLPEPLIVRALERGLPDVELPAVGLIAVRASVPVDAVVELRLGGMSYVDLTTHYGLSSEIYHVPFDSDPGPPYGNAWGYWKQTPRAEWRTVKLADADIVHYSNLKLVVDRYHVAPTEVVTWHKGGKGYAAIHTEVVKVKGDSESKAAKSSATASKPKSAKEAKGDADAKSKGTKSNKKEKNKPPAS